MRTESIRALRGPNLWSDETGLEAVVVGTPETFGTDAFARLCGVLPQTVAERMFREVGGNGTGFSTGSTLFWARIVGALALALQAAADSDVHFTRVSELPTPGHHCVTIEYKEEAVGRRALELSIELVEAARENRPSDVAAMVTELRKLNESVRLGPSTGSIVRAAE